VAFQCGEWNLASLAAIRYRISTPTFLPRQGKHKSRITGNFRAEISAPILQFFVRRFRRNGAALFTENGGQ
jgi:hypothetical protein